MGTAQCDANKKPFTYLNGSHMSNWMRLTESTGAALLVNLDHVLAVSPLGDPTGTLLLLADGTSRLVTEQFEEIANKLGPRGGGAQMTSFSR
jgi:hypothetical protein